MANKYAVANGAWSATATWSDTDGGAGGAAVPADGDAVFISANVAVLMDADLSTYTGLFAVTIRGHATTPGMLYFKDGTSGYLKMRTSYGIVGTSGTLLGRLLANADGVWRGIKGTTVTGSASGDTLTATAHGLTDGQIVSFFPADTVAVLPAPLAVGVNYWVRDKTDDTFKVAATSGGAAIDLTTNGSGTFGVNTCLAFANKAVISFGATGVLDCQYLDVALCCTNPAPGKWFTRTYGTKYDFNGATAVTPATDVIDLGTTPPAAGTAVMVTTAAGTLPVGLYEDTIYYVRFVSGNTCKLCLQNSDITLVDITAVGSGTISLITGHTNTATATVNVLDDVSGDPAWVTTADHNRAVLACAGPQNYDQQRLTLATINATSIVLSANVDSVQYPGGRIVLSSRNVSIRSACVTTVYVITYNARSATGTGVFQCEMVSTQGQTVGVTTFYGCALWDGLGHVMSGVIMGWATPLLYGTEQIVSGFIVANLAGPNHSNRGVFTGDVIACGSSSGYGCSFTMLWGCSTGTDPLYSSTVGTVMGGNYGYLSGHRNTYTLIKCCNYASGNAGTGHIIGTIMGCATALSNNQRGTRVTTIIGCTTVVANGCDIILTNLGRTPTGEVCANGTDFSFSAVSPARIVMRGGLLPSSPVFGGRSTYCGSAYLQQQGLFSEDHGRVLGASYAWLPSGDVIKNTATVRTGGAASSLEVVPNSYCSALYASILVCEWTELAVPASAQNKSVYVKGEGWSSYPTAAELYLEVEYISNATTFARTTVASTQVLTDNTTWVQLATGSFTPAVAGHVRYRVWLKKYAASCKVYLSNELVNT